MCVCGGVLQEYSKSLFNRNQLDPVPNSTKPFSILCFALQDSVDSATLASLTQVNPRTMSVYNSHCAHILKILREYTNSSNFIANFVGGLGTTLV